MEKEIKEGDIIPIYTDQFIDMYLKYYPEKLDPRNMTYEEFLWYQSRRSFLLEIKEKLKQQGGDMYGD